MLSYALLALSILRQAPAGTQLHVRLDVPIASYSTQAGSPISAVLIAPVTSSTGEILFPEGSMLTGTVKRAQRVGFGIMHETAALDLEFDEIAVPGGRAIPLATRLSEVDNSRERVTGDGAIRGVRTTSSLSY